MKPLYTQEEFENAKSTEKLPFECYYCHNTFYRFKKLITYELKNQRGEHKFCSRGCSTTSYNPQNPPQQVNCKQCNKKFIKAAIEIKRTKNNFCNHSCAITYTNAHKKHGTRRSKLEIWLEQQLLTLYPNLEFHFNRVDAINSELDIYIPSLKLAFELNGIFHYEPIFGEAKLNQTQNNDQRKFQACAEKGISLCVIDVSQQKYFKEQSSQKYLDIVTNIIQQNLSHQ